MDGIGEDNNNEMNAIDSEIINNDNDDYKIYDDNEVDDDVDDDDNDDYDDFDDNNEDEDDNFDDDDDGDENDNNDDGGLDMGIPTFRDDFGSSSAERSISLTKRKNDLFVFAKKKMQKKKHMI